MINHLRLMMSPKGTTKRRRILDLCSYSRIAKIVYDLAEKIKVTTVKFAEGELKANHNILSDPSHQTRLLKTSAPAVLPGDADHVEVDPGS